MVEPDRPRFAELVERFDLLMPARSLIVVDVERIADSCGYSVLLFEYQGERKQLARWAKKKEREGKLEDYAREKNRLSIDGLEGLRLAAPEK